MMQLVRDILDKQVVDRHQMKMGKVDGIIAELRKDKPPRIAFVEVGSVALARRLGPRLGRLVSRLAVRLGGRQRRKAYRIAWSKVRDIGVDIQFDIDVRETPIFDWQNWLRDHVIGRIPGA
jgi:sporulation protein YlmC with PRC-barrel domain